MTVDEITRSIRRQTGGLLNDGEVVYAVEMALQSQGGLEPDDIDAVDVKIGHGTLDIQFILRENTTVTLT